MTRGRPAPVWIVGTVDTKAQELEFVKARLGKVPGGTLLIDISTRTHGHAVDVAAKDVAGHHPDGSDAVFGARDRGAAVGAMQTAFARYCVARQHKVAGVIGLGGGGGTAMVAAGLRTLPIGLPKLIVSTLASGDVSAYVDTSDVAMFPAVTDFAGLNSLSRQILANAAAAMAGMVTAPKPSVDDDRPAVGMTMFGVTTDAVTMICQDLATEAECMVFHATGAGGRVMEQLARDAHLAALLDITTTEIADLLVGGILAARPDRLDVVAETGIPLVGSVGALDMVNFGAFDTVPEKFRARRLHVHNSNVTLMRTTPSECARIGAWIADKLNRCHGPVRFLIPQLGISALDIEGGPFWDPAADEALISAILRGVEQTDERRVVLLPCHINAPAFARAAVAAYKEIKRT